MKLLKKLISILVITAVCMPAVSCSSDTEVNTTYAEISSGPDVTTVQTSVPSIEAAMSIALVSHMLDYPNFV